MLRAWSCSWELRPQWLGRKAHVGVLRHLGSSIWFSGLCVTSTCMFQRETLEMKKDFKHVSESEILWIEPKVPLKIVFYVAAGRYAVDWRPRVGQPQTTNQTPLPTSVNMVLLVSHMPLFIHCFGYFQTTIELSHCNSFQGLIKLEVPAILDLYRKNGQHTG